MDVLKILAVDPGLRHCGVCILDDGEIAWAGLAKNSVRTIRGPEAWRGMAQAVSECYPLGVDWLVVEVPQVYRGPYSKGDPADLIELAGVDGAIVGLYEGRAIQATGFLPKQWAGSIPKDVRHQRLKGTLSEEATKNVEWPAPSLSHNVWDAIGLALWFYASHSER